MHSLKVKLDEEKEHNEEGQGNESIVDDADATDKVELEGPKEEETDETRKSGGFGTYKYYFLALGPVAMLMFVVILMVNAFLNGFQCRPAFFSTKPTYSSEGYADAVQMSGSTGGLKAPSAAKTRDWAIGWESLPPSTSWTAFRWFSASGEYPRHEGMKVQLTGSGSCGCTSSPVPETLFTTP